MKGNANYVRGAHYPHDPRVIDRFDEAGIVFWSETIGPGVSVQNTMDWDFFMKYVYTVSYALMRTVRCSSLYSCVAHGTLGAS